MGGQVRVLQAMAWIERRGRYFLLTVIIIIIAVIFVVNRSM